MLDSPKDERSEKDQKHKTGKGIINYGGMAKQWIIQEK
jgi:hypothetical protein